jgi:photosystem II stability/assembly factor-like uncharacterized protein
MKRIAVAVAGLALAGGLGVTAGLMSAAAATPAPPDGTVPAGFEPASVTFISAADGWVLGTTRTCAHAPCTAVLRTTDGGRSWTSVPPPPLKLADGGMSAGLQRLRFASPDTGFAYGSQLWVTRDGGARWHRVVRQVPGYVTDLETAAGRVYLTAQRGSTVTVYSSPAGTVDFRPVAGLPRRSGYAQLGTVTLHGRAGWIILGDRIYATGTGAGWTRLGFRCPRDYGIASVGAYSPARVSVLCSGEPGLGSTPKLVYASDNGGTSFTRAGTPPAGGDAGLLAEPAPRHLFIATSSGATWTYVSTDGGRRWRDGALSLDDGGLGWNDFGFTTASQGVAVEGTPHSGSKLWITRDGGRRWRRVTF